ncbi:MAG TPA: hypothetical protein VJ417_02615, partial [Candidatus Glassbacteria bacterium]|nr:hypothetical protein [Candidatus Glassbacteria bacterium]
MNSSVTVSSLLRYRANLPREAEVPVFPEKVFGVMKYAPLPYFLKYNMLTKDLAGAKFRYIPNDFELSSALNYRKNQRFDQTSRNFRLDSLYTAQNAVRVNYRPFLMSQASYNLTATRNLMETGVGSKALGFNVGNEIDRRQSFQVQLNPKSVPWLTPQFRYDANYNNDHSPQYVLSFPVGSDYRKFDTRQQQTLSVRFSIPQFRQSLLGIRILDPNRKKAAGEKKEQSSSAAYNRPTRGRGRGEDAQGEGRGFVGKYVTGPINTFLDGFDALTYQSNFSSQDRWERMPANPGLGYQFGLRGLSIAERLRRQLEDPTAIDTVSFSSFTWNFNHSYQTALRLMDTRFTFSYVDQGNNTHSLNGYQLTRTVGPELGFDYSNVWVPFFLRGALNRLDLASSYQLRKGFRGNSIKIDNTVSRDGLPKNPLGIESITREEQWNPMYRVQANWGKTGNVRTRYQKTNTTKTDELTDQNRRQVTVDDDDNFNLTYSFSAPQGLPFIKLKLKSNVRSSLDLRRRISRNYTEVLGDKGNVNETLLNRDTEDITITPTLGYDFAQVIGNLSASYNAHKDRKSGTTRITITMKLSIQLDF